MQPCGASLLTASISQSSGGVVGAARPGAACCLPRGERRSSVSSSVPTTRSDVLHRRQVHVFLFSLCYHHRPASGNRSFTGPFVRSAIFHLLYVLRVSRPQPEGEMCQACMKSVVHANPLWKLMAVATHMLVKTVQC